MTTIKVVEIERTYTNFGNHVQQALDYTLTGQIRPHDHVPFHIDSDIPELHISVKSSGFSLASAKVNFGNTKEEKIEDYFARTASTHVAYVSKDMVAYIMDMVEFREFLNTFTYMDRESAKNGGGAKVKALSESKKMLRWLNERVG